MRRKRSDETEDEYLGECQQVAIRAWGLVASLLGFAACVHFFIRCL